MRHAAKAHSQIPTSDVELTLDMVGTILEWAEFWSDVNEDLLTPFEGNLIDRLHAVERELRQRTQEKFAEVREGAAIPRFRLRGKLRQP